jgi:hypothetical protein
LIQVRIAVVDEIVKRRRLAIFLSHEEHRDLWGEQDSGRRSF